jgi:hypothetical protein
MKRIGCGVLMALLLSSAFSGQAKADYGAIAYSPTTGRWGYSYGYRYLSGAQGDALIRCGSTDARVVVWVQNGWAALAVGDNGAYGWGWSTSSLAKAKARALQNAGANARIRCWVYSGY